MRSVIDVKYDLILVLPSQIFEYSRVCFQRHALEYLQSARSEKKEEKVVFLRKRLAIIVLFERPVVGGDTFLPLALVLGPEQNNWPGHPLPLLMAVSMILRSIRFVTFELTLQAGYSWGRELPSFNLNQLVLDT